MQQSGLARRRNVPRSQLYTEAFQEYLAHYGPEAMTAKLDEVHAAEDSRWRSPFPAQSLHLSKMLAMTRRNRW